MKTVLYIALILESIVLGYQTKSIIQLRLDRSECLAFVSEGALK